MKHIFTFLLCLIGISPLFASDPPVFSSEIDSLINLARQTLKTGVHYPIIPAGYYEKAEKKIRLLPLGSYSLDSCLSFYLEALNLTERMLNNEARNKTDRRIYLEAEAPLLEGGIEVCKKLYHQTKEIEYFAKAFNLSEKSKSLYNYFNNDHLKKTLGIENVPDSILNKKAVLTSKISSLRDSLRYGRSTTSFQRLQNWNNQLSEVDRLLKDSFPNFHDFSELNEAKPFGELQEVIFKNEAIFEYYFGEDSVYSFIVLRDTQIIHTIPNADKINKQIKEFSQALQEPGYYEKFIESGYWLYQNLFERHTEFLGYHNINQITVVPDESLSTIPFEALIKGKPGIMSQDYSTLEYLIYSYQFSYNNSATQLIRQRESPSQKSIPPKIAAFAPGFGTLFHKAFEGCSDYSQDSMYLQACKDSLRYFVKNLEWLEKELKAKVYSDFDATISNFKEHIGDDILHLGTHVIFDAEYPMLSKIVFSKEIDFTTSIPTTFGGFLTLEKIQTLHLNGQLVILAGCESGRSNDNKASGTNSIAYGFNLAGIPCTMYSLWRINEKESTELIKLFYQNLRTNIAKDKALHLAKKKYLNDAKDMKAAPKYWAAFIIYGDMTPFAFEPPTYPKTPFLWLGLIPIIVLLYFLISKKKFR